MSDWCEPCEKPKYHCDCDEEEDDAEWEDISSTVPQREKSISIQMSGGHVDAWGYVLVWKQGTDNDPAVYIERYKDHGKLELLQGKTVIVRTAHESKYTDCDIKVVDVGTQLPPDDDAWHYSRVDYKNFN